MSISKYVLLFVVTAVSLVGPQGGRDACSAPSDKWDLWSDQNTPSSQETQKTEKPAEHIVTPPDAAATDKPIVTDKGGEGANTSMETTSSPAEPPSPKHEATETTPAEHQEVERAAQPSGQVPPSNVQNVDATSAADKKTSHAGTSEAVAGESYIIGPGDLLDVSVWKDDALTRVVVVLPDGKITFPLIGEVAAAGRTVGQVKEDLINKLSDYVPELVLNVEVKQSNSMFVYVIGRVNQPGKQVLNSTVTVLQALAMAGGPNPFASRNKIKVFRKEGDKTVIHPFHYNDVVSDENLETNIDLQRGDVIVVP